MLFTLRNQRLLTSDITQDCDSSTMSEINKKIPLRDLAYFLKTTKDWCWPHATKNYIDKVRRLMNSCAQHRGILEVERHIPESHIPERHFPESHIPEKKVPEWTFSRKTIKLQETKKSVFKQFFKNPASVKSP